MNISTQKKMLASLLIPLAASLSFASEARAQSQVRVQWRVQGVTETHVVQLGPIGHAVTLASIQPAPPSRVQAQCAMVSAQARAQLPEEGIRLVMTPYQSPTGQTLLQVVFDYQKFLGIEQHEISPGCLVSNGKSMRLNESSTVLLERNKPTELFKDTTAGREADGYTVTVEML